MEDLRVQRERQRLDHRPMARALNFIPIDTMVKVVAKGKRKAPMPQAQKLRN